MSFSRYTIYLPASPSRWCIHCLQRYPLTYLGLNAAVTDQCQPVTECRKFWESIVIALVCCVFFFKQLRIVML